MNTSAGEPFHLFQVALSRGSQVVKDSDSKTDSQATMGGLISAPLSAVLLPDTVRNVLKSPGD